MNNTKVYRVFDARYFYTVILLTLSMACFGQKSRVEPCRSEINWKLSNASDPSFTDRRLAEEVQNSNLIVQSARTKEQQKYVIPIVVHVLYQTDQQNVSDDKIHAQINQLNKDFAKLNEGAPLESEPFGSVAADMRIEFKLAELDPMLQPTNGINRRNTSVSGFDADDRMKFKSEGGLDAWNPKQYLNFWVCTLKGGVAGYASFPSELSDYPLHDGVVVDYRYFGTNRLATHEIGHWLNLRHIWGDEECGDDKVVDTPVHEGPNYDCPSYPHNINGPCIIGSDGEMFMNFMDYADNQCTTMFTAGQRDRAHATLKGTRKDILYSKGLILDVESDKTTAQIFPNPSSGIVNLKLNGSSNQKPDINIFDLAGNQIDFQKDDSFRGYIQLKLLEYKPGIHFVVIERGSDSSIQKISFL